MKYVKVVIDNVSDHTDTLFTYECPDDSVEVGSVVQVPFGLGNKVKKAFVFEVSDQLTEPVPRIKSVIEVSGEYTIPADLIHMCSWMKENYLCRYIDGIKCVMPPGAPAKRGRNDPYADMSAGPDYPPVLTPEQADAYMQIVPYIDKREHERFLINGVTSSGKTELYMRITQRVLEKGRSVIILVPEISLTPQTIERFMARFGSEIIAVLHSRMTKGQRYDQWMRVRKGDARILIGVRSGVFAPFADLGAVIIDEEHEASYKSDSTPKYDAIDAAMERGRISDAVVVLGTATPSVLSEFRAQSGFYRQIYMRKRYNSTPLPDVSIVDMRQELRQGNRSVFSRELYSRMKGCIESGRQVILFLNRRGYSAFVSCRSCGYVMKCPSCDISLTYHRSSGMAECHYCGRHIKVPDICPSCGSPHIRHFGIGTEKVEELTKAAFPQAAVARLDLDTARKKGETERILKAFSRGKTDILIGTQLVAKGLDIANVALVGIVAADITLNIPDYRSSERTFQLIVQASGRAGRGGERGNVVIQTYNPENKALLAAAAGDYDSFYRHEIRVRSLTAYPPFTNIIRLVFTGEKEDNVIEEAGSLYRMIMASGIAKKGEVFAPQPAYMSFINENWRYHVIIKSPADRTGAYLELIGKLKRERAGSGSNVCSMVVEVDPYSIT